MVFRFDAFKVQNLASQQRLCLPTYFYLPATCSRPLDLFGTHQLLFIKSTLSDMKIDESAVSFL